MANQQRTEGPVLVIDNLSGVNQLIHDLNLTKEATPWLRGMFPDDKGNLQRIPGKLAMTTGSFGGPVFTLHQLEFTDKDLVLIHQSSNYKIETDVSELLSSQTIELTAPVDSFIF